MLEVFVVGQIYAFLLIFARIGAGVMVLPGIGESYVSPRSRLLFALMASLVLTPVFQDNFSEVPGSPLTLFVVIITEIVTGLFMGLMSRIMIATMHVAGMIISYQSSLALATIFDNTQGGQTSVIGNYLTLTSVVLFFTLDLHHLMLQGLADSYTLIPPGQFLPFEDFSNHIAGLVQRIFTMGVQIAAPHIVIGLLFYTGAGVLSRLVPSMQVFFVMMPLQILFSFFLLAAIFTDIMFDYTRFVETELIGFLGQ